MKHLGTIDISIKTYNEAMNGDDSAEILTSALLDVSSVATGTNDIRELSFII